jgi:hypothetical protein
MKKFNFRNIICIVVVFCLILGMTACAVSTDHNIQNNITTNTASGTPSAIPSEPDESNKPSIPANPVIPTEPSATEPSYPVEPPVEPTEPQHEPTDPGQPTDPDNYPDKPDVHEHNYLETVVAPTCTDKGYTDRICDCGDYYRYNEVDPLGHNYSTKTVKRTHLEKGYDIHTCQRCNHSYKDNYVEPIKYQEVNETVYANAKVNVRIGPSTEYERIGSLAVGDSVTRIGIGEDGWSKVIYNGQEAYVFSAYLQKEKPAVKYTDEDFPLVYTDDTCTITITREWHDNAWCYIAHIKFTDYSRFGSTVAKNKRGSYETTSAAAKRIGAIFCVNGPYQWGDNDGYAVIRDGVVFKDAVVVEDMAVYNAATGMFASAGQLGLKGKMASEAVELGMATDTFKFYNSTLVQDSKNMANINNDSRAQRTFIGTTGNAGELYIVVAEGRRADGQSSGLTKYQCAEVLLDLNCSYGIMLDGGGSSTMYFNGQVLNSADGNERAVVDFLYFK